MKKVVRADILDYLTYDEHRQGIRASAMETKALRRVHAGPYLTFLFENPETVRYQVLEMVRAEGMVRESDIQHELDTYNALLGEEGDLGCTLFIEIEDEAARADLLCRWRDLPGHVLLRLADGKEIEAQWDKDQMSVDKLSSVQFLRFHTGVGARPVALVVTHPELKAQALFEAPVREALASDLAK
jgi:hypothetical protein